MTRGAVIALVVAALLPAPAAAHVEGAQAPAILPAECVEPSTTLFYYVPPPEDGYTTGCTYDWGVGPPDGGAAYEGEAEAAADDPAAAGPVAVALPTWKNLYDWPNGHGYVGWHTASSSATLYSLQSNLGGTPGLWLWPAGGDYPGSGFAEWTYTAPGTTRIAKVDLSFAYRNKLLAHHCLAVGLRTATAIVAQHEWCKPAKPPDSQRDVPVTLVDPTPNPVAKVLFFRIRMDCKDGTTSCVRNIPQLDPLQTAGTAQLKFVDIMLVDDDNPEVTAWNEFTQQTYIAGRESYALAIGASDAGSGITRTWAERIEGSVILSSDAPCDRAHFTPALDARVCPETFVLHGSVDTAPMPEGRNEFVARATDVAGNAGASAHWRVLIDRTGPNAVTMIDVAAYEAETRIATIGWDPSGDPPLPTGEEGSGVAKVEFRYQHNQAPWTDWTDPDAGADTLTPAFDVPNVGVGDVIAVEVRQTDAVGNIGATGASTLTVTGAETEFGDLPLDEDFPLDDNPVEDDEPPPGFPEQPWKADDEDLDFEPFDFGEPVPVFSTLRRLRAIVARTPDVPAQFDESNPCGRGLETLVRDGSASGVRWREFRNCIVFFTSQSDWTIYKNCAIQTQPGAKRGVGPGYIATVRDPHGFLVNDFRWREEASDAGLWNTGNLGSVNGGLGTFEVQYTRGLPGRTHGGGRDFVTGENLARSGLRPPDGAISERTCANATRGFGVYARTLHRPTVRRGTVRYQIEVWLKDPVSSTGAGPGGTAILRVQHLYRFSPSTVEAIHTVTTFGAEADAQGRVPQAKEPKFGAALRAPGRFTEMRVFRANNTVARVATRGQEERPGAVLHTRHSGADDRLRVRWGCASAAAAVCPPGSSESNACVNGCFNALMRSRAIPSNSKLDPFLAAVPLWENKPGSKALGLDGWARRSAALAGTGATQRRAKAYVRDTFGDNAISACSAPVRKRRAGESDASYFPVLARASENAHPGMQAVRRWELAGWKPGVPGGGDRPDNTFSGSITMFIGWEGARGPYDCEPLAVSFGPSTETYSTYARYWLVDG